MCFINQDFLVGLERRDIQIARKRTKKGENPG